MRNDFAVFILTHGRADNVVTYNSLRNGGYTGKIYLIIDNTDKMVDEYYKRYGDDVIIFDKEEIAKKIDTMDNTGERKVIIFARHANFEIAKKLGLKYFLQLDDDYTDFHQRYEEHGKLKYVKCKTLDRVFNTMIDFLEDTGALTVALGQGGDFIGGTNSTLWKEELTRKAMNTFFCKTDSPINFTGTMNDDVTAYVSLGTRGKLFFTTALCNICQIPTQAGAGGSSEVYVNGGTYLKTMYTVVAQPSCVKVGLMGNKNMRIHHQVQWNNCVPMILNEKWRKTKK